jgi:6-phosphogluconolactonase
VKNPLIPHLAVILVAGCIQMPALAAPAKTFVYVSNAEDGNITSYDMNRTTGVLTPLGKTEAGKLVMPMALSPDKRYLYAVIRSIPFKVATYAINPATGALTQKALAPLPENMSYLSTDQAGHFLLQACYGGNLVAVNPVDADGIARAEAIQVVPTGVLAHSIRTERTNRFAFAANMASSQIMEFKFDAKTGKLTPNEPALIKVKENNGPRHLIISPDNQYLYLICELTGNVVQYAIDPKAGTLKELNYTSSVYPGSGMVIGAPRVAMSPTASSGANTKADNDDGRPKIWAADIHMTPNGKFMYTSERTQSSLSLLTVAPKTGKLTYVNSYPTETQPRGFNLDPRGRFVVAVGEKSDQVSSYKVNQKSGELTLVGRYPGGHDANWVEIVDFH